MGLRLSSRPDPVDALCPEHAEPDLDGLEAFYSESN